MSRLSTGALRLFERYNREGLQTTMASSWPKLFLFGDSQTQQGFTKEGCWCSIIANKFERKCDILNRGFSGYNSRWCKLMLPKLLPQSLANECVAATIFLGSNDANLPDISALQHVPVDEFEQNICAIISYMKEVGIDENRIFVISPPPVDSELWGEEMKKTEPDRVCGLRNDVMEGYAVASKRAADKMGVCCINLYTTMMAHEDWKKFVEDDGLHLALQGSELLAQMLWEKLEPISDSLNEQFPDWKDFDNSNPSSTFASYSKDL